MLINWVLEKKLVEARLGLESTLYDFLVIATLAHLFNLYELQCFNYTLATGRAHATEHCCKDSVTPCKSNALHNAWHRASTRQQLL